MPTLTGSGGGRIVFSSSRDGNYEIYVMNADGSDQRRVTHSSADDKNPVWSPDGTQIAFESDRRGLPAIYVLDVPDGTNADAAAVRLLTPEGRNRSPSWSPDGSQIAFIRYDGNADVYVINADGSNLRQLTQTPRHVDAIDLAWSPDGKEIAFTTDSHPADEHVFAVYVLNIHVAIHGTDENGQEVPKQRRLHQTDNPLEGAPAWAADGTRVAFCAMVDKHWRIQVVNADGTDLRQLSAVESYDDYVPAWNLDGSRIAFQSNRDGHWEIYVMDSTGSGQQRLTSGESDNLAPDWAP